MARFNAAFLLGLVLVVIMISCQVINISTVHFHNFKQKAALMVHCPGYDIANINVHTFDKKQQ